ncbi:hypothetical protein JL721_1721 [Aureococcus anophagefferens]|nr:hypothetical protein JL721_1721 [Aureococcus anophagefferens]
MPTIEPCGVSFDKVAYELRCKYAGDESGGPANSASLKAAEALLQEYLPALKALPGAEVTRVMCGGCHDFKIVVNQPCTHHDAWKAADYAPAPEILAKLKAIEGISSVETQEYTCQPL